MAVLSLALLVPNIRTLKAAMSNTLSSLTSSTKPAVDNDLE